MKEMKRLRRRLGDLTTSDKLVAVASILVLCVSISFSRYVGALSARKGVNDTTSVVGSNASGVKRPTSTNLINTKGYSIEGKVEVIEWPASKGPFASEIAKRSTPVILRNTIVKQWPALKKWNPDYLSEWCKETLPISISDQPVFTYASPKRPMAHLAALQWQQPHHTERLTIKQFWEKVKDQKEKDQEEKEKEKQEKKEKEKKEKEGEAKKYFYLTGGVKEKLHEVSNDVQPSETLIPQHPQHHPHVLAEMERLGIEVGGGEESNMNVWMGVNGVTAQTHYDWSYNFYVQIYGTKTFLLSPPSEHRKMKLFPSLHPSRRQSQIDFTNPSLEDLQIKAIQADLKPGDVLYLPPFWFHRVIATGSSISVNMWTGSPEEDLGDLLEFSPIPFDSHWTKDQKLIALVQFIQMLMQMTEEHLLLGKPTNEMAGLRLLQDVVAGSYVTLFGNTRNNTKGECELYLLKEGETKESLREFVHREDIQSKLRLGAERVLQYLKESGIPQDERLELMVWEYCEKIANFFVGIEQVNEFFQDCIP